LYRLDDVVLLVKLVVNLKSKAARWGNAHPCCMGLLRVTNANMITDDHS
jgi:hypothetical protein